MNKESFRLDGRSTVKLDRGRGDENRDWCRS